MKKFVLFNFLLTTHIVFAAQTIQIHAQLPPESPAAALLVVINDLDQGKSTPYLMPLAPGQTLQTFQVEGNHYQIIQWTIQAPNLAFSPCAPTQSIDNRSLIVTLTGKIVPGNLKCALREVAAIPQLAAYVPTTSVAPSVTPAASTDKKSADKEIAAYLTALSKPCEKGTFQASFETQTVTYNILGMNAGNCDVSIRYNKLPPVSCHLNNNDIALLTSPTEINSYINGTAEHSENSLSARIMKARCQTTTTLKKI